MSSTRNRLEEWFSEYPKEKNKLIERLKSQDKHLAFLVKEWCERVRGILDRSFENFKQYTGHGAEHSDAMLTCLDWLIPLDVIEKMHALEIALLVLAVYHHDIGMAFDIDRKNTLMKDSEWMDEKDLLINKFRESSTVYDKSVAVLEELAFVEWTRSRHAKESVHWIEANRIGNPDYRLEDYFDYDPWEDVKELCRIHTEPSCDELPTKKPVAGLSGIEVNMCFLGCALRLADTCHVTVDRADEQMAKFICFTDEFSRLKHRERQILPSVGPDSKNRILIVVANPPSTYFHRAVAMIGREIKEELERTNMTLLRKNSDFRLPWWCVDFESHVKARDDSYIYSDWEYRLDRSKVYDLLMGKNLYVDMSVCVRELLQNAVDAVRARWGREAPTRGIITCRRGLLKNREGQEFEVIEIEDNGIGMDEDIIANHLLKVPAESFYGTNRFKLEHRDSSNVLVPTAQHGIGFLSTFWAARTVEIFTWYDFFSPTKSPKPIHVELASLDKGAVHRTTAMNDFPEGVRNGRGTCVRLWLTNRLTDWACSHKTGNWNSLEEIVEYWARRVAIPIRIEENSQTIMKFGESKVPPNAVPIQDKALGISGYIDMSVGYRSPEATDLQVTVLGFYVGRNPFRKEKLGLWFPKGELDFSGKRDFNLTVDRNDFQEIKRSKTLERARSLLFESANNWIRQKRNRWDSDAMKKLRNLLLHNRVLGENKDLRDLVSTLPIFKVRGTDIYESIEEILKKPTYLYIPIRPRFRKDVWDDSDAVRRFSLWYEREIDNLQSQHRLLLEAQMGLTLPVQSFVEFAPRSKHRQIYPLHLLDWLCDARLEFTEEGWPLLRLLARNDAIPTHGWGRLLEYEPDKRDWLICSTDGEAYWVNPYCPSIKDVLGDDAKITQVKMERYHGRQLAKRPADGFLYPYDEFTFVFDTSCKRQPLKKTVKQLGELVNPFDRIDFWIRKFRDRVNLSEEDLDALLSAFYLDVDSLPF